MHYERVRNDLQQVERAISMALRLDIDPEAEERVLEEALSLVQQAAERCLLVQTEPIRETFSQGMNME